LKKIIAKYGNFYLVVGAFFFIWMLFLDSNDLISRFRLMGKLNSLKNEKEYYLEKMEEVKQTREELMGNQQLLEKFAREKYLMKKPSEDIFIVVED
jgi:cell division protein DivIC